MNLQAMKRQDVPLHAEVAAVLRHQILSGDLAPGDRLPALRELTETLGVARMTVAQAMNTLEDEGLIEKHPGRGTFVCDVPIADRHLLQMAAPLSQIYAMVERLEVLRCEGASTVEMEDGRQFHAMRRIHARGGSPFCQVDIRLEQSIYDRAPDRFLTEIVVAVLNDLGVRIAKGRQAVTIGYADFALAQALGVKVNSPVFRVRRTFLDAAGQLIYSADLVYPGDMLELEIEFCTGVDAGVNA